MMEGKRLLNRKHTVGLYQEASNMIVAAIRLTVPYTVQPISKLWKKRWNKDTPSKKRLRPVDIW